MNYPHLSILYVYHFGWTEMEHFWKARSKMDRLIAVSSWKLNSLSLWWLEKEAFHFCIFPRCSI